MSKQIFHINPYNGKLVKSLFIHEIDEDNIVVKLDNSNYEIINKKDIVPESAYVKEQIYNEMMLLDQIIRITKGGNVSKERLMNLLKDVDEWNQ